MRKNLYLNRCLTMVKKQFNQNIYTPKTENQKKYFEYLNKDNNYIISAMGPAGTGKTLMACLTAINHLREKKIEKIIITRPVISVEEEIGFLPGNIEKKMDPWTRPIFDIFSEYYSKPDITDMMSKGVIEISPLGFMRGRTFKYSFIIADEMQNSSKNQMLMLLTRIGLSSKMVITGDLEQSDKTNDNGLRDFINRIEERNNTNNIYLIKMDKNDVQRSDLVNEVLSLYSEQDKVQKTYKNYVDLDNL